MPQESTEPVLGTIELVSRESSFSLNCSALASDAIDGQPTLMLASVAGAHTSIKAFRAALSTGNTRFRSTLPSPQYIRDLSRWSGGYDVHTHRLGCRTWHLVAVARQPGLIPQLDDLSLWKELSSPRFTTPLLQSWVLWMREELERRKLLKPLKAFQCQPAILNATSDKLDAILSDRAPLSFA